MTATAILIDSREPQSIQALSFDGLPKMVTMLDCGDVWIATDTADQIIVERKTPADLLGSIRDKRIFAQCAAMREKSPWSYVCITAPLTHQDGKVTADGRSTGWAWEAVQGALLDIQEMGVRVVTCASEADFAPTLLRLARRDRTEDKVIQPAADVRLLTHGEQILTALPGIGLERAQETLKQFPRAADALTWLTWQNTFLEVAGIGKGTKGKVRAALGLLEDEELFVMTPMDYKNAAQKLTTDDKLTALPIAATFSRDETGTIWA